MTTSGKTGIRQIVQKKFSSYGGWRDFIRWQKRLKVPDAIILATAEAAGRVLVTRNVKDFPVGIGGVRAPYKV
jgi:predicted nucleic acid-binding protein